METFFSRLMRATISKISLDDQGCEAERGLVEQDHPGIGDQRAADRQHLLLAAREIAGGLVAALRQDGEVVVDLVEGILARERADRCANVAAIEVFLHGHLREDVAAFTHVEDARAAR